LNEIEVPVEIEIEIFPKQDFVPENKLGNLIKLPLGKHKKTGQFSGVVDTNFEKYSDQFLVLKHFDLNTEKVFNNIHPAYNKTSYDKSYLKKKQPENEIKIAKTRIILPEKISQKYKNLENMFNNCNVLRYILLKPKEKIKITIEEQKIIYNILYYIDERLLKYFKTPYLENIDLSKTDTPGFPVSCSEIKYQLKLSHIKNMCNCNFIINENEYPSPLIYYDRTILSLINLLPANIEDLLKEKHSIEIKLKELQERKNYIDSSLKKIFSQIGEKFETRTYRFEAINKDNKTILKITKKEETINIFLE